MDEFIQDMRVWLQSVDPNGDFVGDEGLPAAEFDGGVEVATDWAKGEVLYDVRHEKTVPDTVKDFSGLHDHVDANKYGGAFDWPNFRDDRSDAYLEAFSKFWNAVQNNVDAWIKAGGLKNEKAQAT